MKLKNIIYPKIKYVFLENSVGLEEIMIYLQIIDSFLHFFFIVFKIIKRYNTLQAFFDSF